MTATPAPLPHKIPTSERVFQILAALSLLAYAALAEHDKAWLPVFIAVGSVVLLINAIGGT